MIKLTNFFQTLGIMRVYKRAKNDILNPLTRVNIIPMTIGIKMKLRVVTCRRQQSWSGLVWTSSYWMGGCNPPRHLLFNLGDWRELRITLNGFEEMLMALRLHQLGSNGSTKRWDPFFVISSLYIHIGFYTDWGKPAFWKKRKHTGISNVAVGFI